MSKMWKEALRASPSNQKAKSPRNTLLVRSPLVRDHQSGPPPPKPRNEHHFRRWKDSGRITVVNLLMTTLMVTIGAWRGCKWRIAMASAFRPAHGLQLTLLCHLLSLIAQCLMLLRRLCGQSNAQILWRFLTCCPVPPVMRGSPGAREDLFSQCHSPAPQPARDLTRAWRKAEIWIHLRQGWCLSFYARAILVGLLICAFVLIVTPF
jgi:hypothetical protein